MTIYMQRNKVDRTNRNVEQQIECTASNHPKQPKCLGDVNDEDASWAHVGTTQSSGELKIRSIIKLRWCIHVRRNITQANFRGCIRQKIPYLLP